MVSGDDVGFHALASTELPVLPVAEVVDTGALSFLTSALRVGGSCLGKRKTWKTPGLTKTISDATYHSSSMLLLSLLFFNVDFL